jgi:hypothetical protein
MPSPWWTATFVKLRKVWVLVAAGYFRTGAAGEEAKTTMAAIEAMTQGFRLPYILLADWNSTPEEVEALGIPSKMRGFLAKTGSKTSTSREIDFGMVAVSPSIQGDYPNHWALQDACGTEAVHEQG